MTRPDPYNVAVLAQKELRDAWRNRWFLLYAGAFTALALGLAWLSVTGVARTGVANLGRTAGSLVNLVILIVPLMGLTLGAQAIAPDRERGSLLYLLAQPVDTLEVVLGKFIGLSSAVLAALLLGFGLAAFAMVRQGAQGDPAPFLGFLALGVLLAMASVSLGLLVSALAPRASMAAGLSLFLWLVLVFVGDLGLMGTTLALDLDVRQLLGFALVNPLQVYKLAAVLVLRGGLEALGPAGLFAVDRLGAALVPALVGILAAWILAPLAVTIGTMGRRGGLA